ncbi:MAG: phage tail protein [Planctomycetota bacterium]|jgi:hypothetical protein
MPYEWKDFSAGEMSPKIHANTNIALTQSGARQVLNMFPTSQGSVVKRPPFEFLEMLPRPNARAIQIPFQFSIEQTYVLVLQDSEMWIGKDGGYVVDPQVGVDVPNTSFSSTTGVGVSISVASTIWGVHLLDPGDVIFIGDAPAGYEELENRLYQVSATGHTTSGFRLEDLYGNMIDIGTIAPASGLDYKPLTVVPIPYTEFHLTDGELDYDQSADTLFIVHPSYQPRVITRFAHHTWTIDLFSASPEQGSPANLTDTARPSGSRSLKYAVTAINDSTGEESLASQITIENTDEPSRDGGAGGAEDPVTLEWDKHADADVYRVYRSINGIFGLLNEARWVSGLTVDYSDLNDRVPLLEIGPPIEVKTTFDSTDEYPGAVALFQQRIWFARTNNNVIGIFASRSGSFSSFAVEEITIDSSPIAQAIAGQGVQAVQWLVPVRDLLILTENGEWTFDKGEQGIITPSSGLRGEGGWGSAKVKPIKVGNSVLFV